MRRNQALIRRLEKTFDYLSILAGLMGCVALILLSIFDTDRHPSLHRLFLFLFMLGVVLSAIFTTAEYWRLGRTFTGHPVLKFSYYSKLVIVVVEVGLAIGFGVTLYKGVDNVAGVLEWLVAFLFTFYLLTFFFDLRPKARTKEQFQRETMEYNNGQESAASQILGQSGGRGGMGQNF